MMKDQSVMYKGLVDGVFGKFSKMLAAFIGLSLEAFCGESNPRYFSPMYSLMIIVLSAFWVASVYKLHKMYSHSVKTGEYLQDVPISTNSNNSAKNAVAPDLKA